MINVEVNKNSSETSSSLIRRFTKRVQGAGILPRVRSLRYSARPVTKFSRKKKTLKKIAKRLEIAELDKLGKLKVEEKRRRR